MPPTHISAPVTPSRFHAAARSAGGAAVNILAVLAALTRFPTRYAGRAVVGACDYACPLASALVFIRACPRRSEPRPVLRSLSRFKAVSRCPLSAVLAFQRRYDPVRLSRICRSPSFATHIAGGPPCLRTRYCFVFTHSDHGPLSPIRAAAAGTRRVAVLPDCNSFSAAACPPVLSPGCFDGWGPQRASP